MCFFFYFLFCTTFCVTTGFTSVEAAYSPRHGLSEDHPVFLGGTCILTVRVMIHTDLRSTHTHTHTTQKKHTHVHTQTSSVSYILIILFIIDCYSVSFSLAHLTRQSGQSKSFSVRLHLKQRQRAVKLLGGEGKAYEPWQWEELFGGKAESEGRTSFLERCVWKAAELSLVESLMGAQGWLMSLGGCSLCWEDGQVLVKADWKSRAMQRQWQCDSDSPYTHTAACAAHPHTRTQKLVACSQKPKTFMGVFFNTRVLCFK